MSNVQWYSNFQVGLKYIGGDDENIENSNKDSEVSEEEENDDLDYDDDYDDIQLTTSNRCQFGDTSSSILPSSRKYEKVLKYCPRPCGSSFQPNDPMCIRTCLCPKNQVVTKEGNCVKLNETMSKKIHMLLMENVNKVWLGGIDKWSPENRSQRDEG